MGEVNDTIAAIGKEGTFTLKVVVGEVSREVNFVVKDNVAANHIEVVANGKLSQTTAETVTFTATLSPAKADVESVKWYVNDKYYSTDKTFSFKPTNRGEYKVTAEINKNHRISFGTRRSVVLRLALPRLRRIRAKQIYNVQGRT